MTQLTAHFSLEEFQRVSSEPLPPAAETNALRFASRILEPARSALGFPIAVTSFYRPGDRKAHGAARAVDFQPCRQCAEVEARPELFAERLEALFQWIATNRSAEFGQLIHERTHLHASVPGYNGETSKVMREPFEGEYVLAAILPALKVAFPFLLLAAVAYLIAVAGSSRG